MKKEYFFEKDEIKYILDMLKKRRLTCVLQDKIVSNLGKYYEIKTLEKKVYHLQQELNDKQRNFKIE